MKAGNRQGYIPEIVGLRGIALSLVVLFHVFGQGRVSGGVDVFLFLSGFLLTWTFLKKATSDGEVSLLHRYGRIARRLIPAALVVLSGVAIATIAFLPRHWWLQAGREILASGLYYENWELIGSQLAYAAAGPSASPLQHFWSMSVQGQFFTLWPLALVLMLRLAKRRRLSVTALVLGVAGVLTALSFGLAQWMHLVDQNVNYLHSATRLWQLTLGASLAAVLPALRIRAVTGSILAWAGIGMVGVSGLLVDGAANFPAYPALLPVLGAAFVLVGSGPDHKLSVQRVLSMKPVTFLASISYPLYLWHWPIMVIFMQYRGQRELGLRSAAAVLVASLVLAWLTQLLTDRWLAPENRTTSPRAQLIRWLSALLAFALSIGVSVLALRQWETRELAALPEGVSAYNPGGLVLTGEATRPDRGWAAPPIPSLSAASRDKPEIYLAGCVQDHREGPGTDQVLVCPGTAGPSARKRIVMSGGSHVLHWYDALKTVATKNNWDLLVVDKDGCRLRLPDSDETLTSCDRWNTSALEVILELQPDAVFTVGTRTPSDQNSSEVVHDSQVQAWEYLSKEGVPTLAIRDTPRFLERVPDCVARVGTEHSDQCNRAESEVYGGVNPLSLVDLPQDTVALDMREYFCRLGECRVHIGNVLVYRDEDHMTSTYSRTLAGALESELLNEAPWLFDEH